MKTIQNLRRFALIALLGGGGLLVQHASAQIQFPVPQPSPKVGDIWKYKTIDLWNGKELRTSENELVAIEADRLVLRNKNSDNPTAANPFTTTLENNPCRSMRGADKPTCVGPFKFPAVIGQKHEYKDSPWPNGLGKLDMKCEIKGEEKITVTAGTFDTIKIECKGYWTRVYEGTGSGGQEEVYWYAPKVHRTVKSYWKNSFQGRVNDQQQFELTEYITK